MRDLAVLQTVQKLLQFEANPNYVCKNIETTLIKSRQVLGMRHWHWSVIGAKVSPVEEGGIPTQLELAFTSPLARP